MPQQIFQYQVQAYPPVGGAPSAPPAIPFNVYPDKMYRSDRKVAVQASGAVMGGDFSGTSAVWFGWLSQPRRQVPHVALLGGMANAPVGGAPTPPATDIAWYREFSVVPHPRRTLRAANMMFTNQVRPSYTGPDATVGEWYGNLSQPMPKRPGLRAALQRAPWLGQPDIPAIPTAPGAFTNPISSGQLPRRQRVALMQAFAIGIPTATGPATTTGTWSRVFSTPKPKRPGLRAALLPFGTISYPTVFPPPVVGGSRTIRRRFIRRGRRG